MRSGLNYRQNCVRLALDGKIQTIFMVGYSVLPGRFQAFEILNRAAAILAYLTANYMHTLLNLD